LATRILVQGCLDLGLLHGTLDENIERETYKRYYMHRTSHWLGMDVHDVGRYHDSLPGGNRSRSLLPGMVLTIEPGLYIASDDLEAPEAFRGIGIRIEDDILVTAGEPDNLTAACVKEVADVEVMTQQPPRWVRPVDRDQLAGA
jgi:Xaa-Pro aminopeptidase